MEKREEGEDRECKRETGGRGEIKWKRERRERTGNVKERQEGEER